MAETTTHLPPSCSQRSHTDKRRDVLTLLHDPAWRQRSDRALARQCGVDHKTVGKWRKALSGDIPQMERTVQRHGTTYTLHLPTAPRQAEPHPPRTPLMIAEAMVSLGLAPAGRLLARLQALPLGKRQAALTTFRSLLSTIGSSP